MAVWSWFLPKKDPEDYEEVLSSLALDIQKRQTRLSEMRLRERRTILLVTVYTFAAWGLYVALWYTGLVPNLSHRPNQSGFEKFAKGVPLVVGPIMIQFTRRIVQTWYARIENAEEKTLKDLYVKQRNKVEEIKKKTNFYSTRDLLERYEAPGSPSSPAALRKRQNIPQTPVKHPAPVQSQPAQPASNPLVDGTPPRLPRVNGAPGGPEPGPLSPNPVAPLVPPRKQWYDKLADALLGDEEFSSNNPQSRYALICQKCFAHNGLVRESMYEETQYVCPKCGHFNPSMNSLKSARSPTSAGPWSPLSPSNVSGPPTAIFPSTSSTPPHPNPGPTNASPTLPVAEPATQRRPHLQDPPFEAGSEGSSPDDGDMSRSQMEVDERSLS